MKEVRLEYKILLVIASIFVITLIYYLIQSGTFANWFIDIKKNNYVQCSEQTYTKGITYTEYRCQISDDVGNTYTLSYPQIDMESEDIINLNRTLKQNFDYVLNTVEYNKDTSKMELSSYTSLTYQIYDDLEVVSLLVTNREVEDTNYVKNKGYTSYNIKKTTGHVLTDEEMRDIYSLDLSFSSKLRAKVINMYAEEFQYNYYDQTFTVKNSKIDSSIEKITINSIRNIYINQNGDISFIIDLYNPTYYQTKPYLITVNNSNIEYKKM